MLSFTDIVGVCECTEAEIKAIAIHEHLPLTVSAELSEYLLHSEGGLEKIRHMIVDNIAYARAHNHQEDLQELQGVLDDFERIHPEYRRH